MHMSFIRDNTPSPNILGKITTGVQIIYISQILIFQALNSQIHIAWLDWLIVALTASSLLVYSREWFTSLKDHHEQT